MRNSMSVCLAIIEDDRFLDVDPRHLLVACRLWLQWEMRICRVHVQPPMDRSRVSAADPLNSAERQRLQSTWHLSLGWLGTAWR